MNFAGVNYPAIIEAAIAAWLVGAGWYTVLARPWARALGTTVPALQQPLHAPVALMFLLAFVAELIMAWVLAGVLGHLGAGQVTLRNGVISGALLWFGFVLAPLAVNHAFARRELLLTALDAGHWLVVILVMGAIIGAWGV